MLKNIIAALLIGGGCISSACAITPSGGWELKNESINVKDYSLRIDVDPGEYYSNAGFAPSSVYWAEYVSFNEASGGYLGLQRAGGTKIALVSFWDGLDDNYRFRIEVSPQTASDEAGDWWQITLADLTLGTIDILGEIKMPKWKGLNRSNGVFLEYF